MVLLTSTIIGCNQKAIFTYEKDINIKKKGFQLNKQYQELWSERAGLELEAATIPGPQRPLKNLDFLQHKLFKVGGSELKKNAEFSAKSPTLLRYSTQKDLGVRKHL